MNNPLKREPGFVHRGGLWVIGQMLLQIAVIMLGVACPGASRHTAATVAGCLLLTVAAMLGVAGAWALGRNLTPFPHPSEKARFVQHGIYGLMRHPLYTAVISGSVGWALVWGSWPAVLAALAMAALLNAKARREERWLCQRFPEYQGYRARVRRFVPWLY